MATEQTSTQEKKTQPATPKMHLCDSCEEQFECLGESNHPSGCKCLSGLYRTKADKWANTYIFYYCSVLCMDDSTNYSSSDDEYVVFWFLFCREDYQELLLEVTRFEKDLEHKKRWEDAHQSAALAEDRAYYYYKKPVP